MKIIEIEGNTKKVFTTNQDHSITLLESKEILNYCPLKGSVLEVW